MVVFLSIYSFIDKNRLTSPAPWNRKILSFSGMFVILNEAKTPAAATAAVPVVIETNNVMTNVTIESNYVMTSERLSLIMYTLMQRSCRLEP